eukprot:TRINITY_DN1657_c0_g2_i2.p1 TRINITY_DN1657_c0_g2~~TRINITY_DN1657_c0_g2_i2.p1  ORF type:complete len:355 (-),score=61.60 TRINITY_DN1657_c0_g2_i2:852-1916(-)
MYRPPFDLMFKGSFDEAKHQAIGQAKWLLVNVQSTREFSSFMLNRDTWSQPTVKEILNGSFVFWQQYDDTPEGRKVCAFYKLTILPAVIVLDPQTGQKMKGWDGMLDADRLLEDLVPFMDRGPLEKRTPMVPPHKRPREREADLAASRAKAAAADAGLHGDEIEDEELQRAIAVSLEAIHAEVPTLERRGGRSNSDHREFRREGRQQEGTGKQPASRTGPVHEATGGRAGPKAGVETARCVPAKELEHECRKRGEQPQEAVEPLPEEPPAGDPMACRIALRFPDGRRGQRRFRLSDSVKLLRSFVFAEVPEAANGRPFHLAPAIPDSPTLNLTADTSFRDACLANSMLVMTWDR